MSAWNNIIIDDNNKNDYNIVCFKKVKIEKINVNDKEIENVYIILDEDKHEIMKINGSIKNLIKNLVDCDNEEGMNNTVLYTLYNLEKNEYNGHSYYNYKLLLKGIKRNIYILNKCKTLTNYYNLFESKQKPTRITITNNIENIEMINNKNNYKYIFNNLDELRDFNKKIYYFIQKHPSVNKIELYNLDEKSFENEEGQEFKFIDFEIKTKEINF